MSIVANSTALASDFISTTAGAGDAGKVPKLNAVGKLDASFLKFGGDGSDGALSISSGTTTLSIASGQILVKNYTSISITGTGKLAFSNPHANGSIVVLKSQGNVTLTSSQTPMIDASAIGASSAGANGYGFSIFETNKGVDSTGGSPAGTPGGGGPIADITSPANIIRTSALLAKYNFVTPGAPGGSGYVYASNSQANDLAAGIAGRGGGVLIIECGGAWNFTTSAGISVGGQNATNATGTTKGSNTFCNASGAGGGGAGVFLAFYNSLTANSGTVTITGGTGSQGLNIGGGTPTTSGAGGGSSLIAGGNAGSQVSAGTKDSGDGATGYSLIAANTEFA